MISGLGTTGKFKENGALNSSIVVTSACEVEVTLHGSGLNPNNSDIIDVVLCFPPGSVMAYWTVDSTSISSVPIPMPKGMGFDIVVEVEAICGDGSCEKGEK